MFILELCMGISEEIDNATIAIDEVMILESDAVNKPTRFSRNHHLINIQILFYKSPCDN